MSDQLARHARKTPDEFALVFERTRRTYRELDNRVTRLANALSARGVRPGDRIAVMALNSLEVIEVYLASVRLGAICVPVNFRLVAGEVTYALSDSGAVVAITDSVHAETMAGAGANLPAVHTFFVFGDDGDPGEHGAEDYEEAIRTASGTYVEIDVDSHSPAFIMYTSGTTGRPKGAVLSHHNLLMHAFSTMVHLGTPNDDRVALSGAPLFHIAGLSGMTPSLLTGGLFVIMPSGRFDPAATVDLLEREGVSGCFFVPAQWQAICAVPGIAERDLSALRRVSWGAAPAPTSLLKKMIETFPHAAVVTSFGQTECSPVTTMLRGEDALRKIGSVGTPMLNVEVRIVDEEMNDVPQGEVGEIVYRGPMVMQEYWGKPQATADVFAGGWFHSGDLVRQDEEGYFYVVDRKKDMIISGGENIYCAEVEDILGGHPQVAEVALIGVADPKWGETPLAVVVPEDPGAAPTEEELVTWCREHMAAYKCPRLLRTVTELPRNPSGKILKTELRNRYGGSDAA
ncbi:long-chain-fatty-acid--CoA ligase [Parasphingorhabdus pacifica]